MKILTAVSFGAFADFILCSATSCIRSAPLPLRGAPGPSLGSNRVSRRVLA